MLAWSRMWFPWASSSWVILLMYHRCTMEQWNNLAFLSPSLSQCPLDFCLHSISSYFLCSSSSTCCFSSSLEKSIVHPCKMNTCCRSSRCCPISYFSRRCYQTRSCSSSLDVIWISLAFAETYTCVFSGIFISASTKMWKFPKNLGGWARTFWSERV